MKYLERILSKFSIDKKGILSIFFLLVCSLIFFYPSLFQNKIPLPTDALVGAHIPWTEYRWPEYPAGVPIKSQEITDAVSQFYPWRSLVGEFWRNKKFPLWNFYMFNGTPFLATLHSAGLYPLNAVYFLFDNATSWTILVYLQVILSMVFMFVFLRELNLDRLSSVFGAIGFGFSGYMIAWLQFATGGHAGLWLPLLLYFLLKFQKTGKKKFLYITPFIFIFVFTAGDFQVPLYLSATYFLFSIYLFWKKELIKNLSLIFCFFCIGVLFSLPQLLPTLDLFQRSVRFDDSYITQYFYGLMHWQKASLFLWSDFFGNVVTRNYWGKYGFHEYMCYVGIIGVVFVIYSFFLKLENYEKFFWIMLLISLAFLFPTPIAFLPYKLKIPALGTSSASRIIYLIDFLLSVLMAYGFNKYKKYSISIQKVVIYLLVITCGLSVGFVISYLIMNDPVTPVTIWLQNTKVTLKNMIPGTFLIITLGIIDFFLIKKYRLFSGIKVKRLLHYLIIFLFFADMLRFGLKNRPFSDKRFLFPKIPILEFLTEKKEIFRLGGGLATNYSMVFGLESTEGYDPIYPKINSDFYSIVDWGEIGYHSGRYGLVHNFESPFLNYASMKYVMDYKKDQWRQINDEGKFYPGIESPRYKETFYDRRVYIFENSKSLPYVWLDTRYVVANDQNELVNIITESENPVIVLLEEPIFDSFEPAAIKYEVTNIVKKFNEISFVVESSDDSIVFIAETYDPGWKLYVDGKSENIYRANYLFQSFMIKKGKHEVSLKYQPYYFYLGLKIAVLSLIIYCSFMLPRFFFNFKRITSKQ